MGAIFSRAHTYSHAGSSDRVEALAYTGAAVDVQGQLTQMQLSPADRCSSGIRTSGCIGAAQSALQPRRTGSTRGELEMT
jgi:hypothetical protein